MAPFSYNHRRYCRTYHSVIAYVGRRIVLKRLFILLSAVIIALIPMSVSAQEEYSDLLAVVSDEDNLFTEDERVSLEESIRTV